MSASVTLTHAASGSSLELVPDAGMVALSWTVAGEEVLALPCGRAEFLAAARTGGLPLLYPYANRLGADSFTACGRQVDVSRVPWLKRDDAHHPIHGLLLRRGGWALSVLGPGAMQAELDWGAHAELMDAFPFPHTLRVTWALAQGSSAGAASLRVGTTVIADRGVDVPVAFGWHPYFRVSDHRSARIRMAPASRVALSADGLPAEGAVARARNAMVAGGATTGAADSAVTAAAAVDFGVGEGQDALYLRAGARADASPVPAASIIDADRRIDILMDAHYPFMQVFSPRGASFACIEPMAAPTDGLRSGDCAVARAGTSFTATFEVCVIPCLPASAPGSPIPPSSAV